MARWGRVSGLTLMVMIALAVMEGDREIHVYSIVLMDKYAIQASKRQMIGYMIRWMDEVRRKRLGLVGHIMGLQNGWMDERMIYLVCAS